MDKLRGLNPIHIKNNNQSISFQIIDWLSTNEEVEEEDEKNNKKKYGDKKKYVIRAFGVTKKGNSISINIHDFPPHYYINIPEEYTQYEVNNMVKAIKGKLPKSFRDSITSHDVIKRKKFWGFTNNKNYLFLRLLFKNTQVMFQVTKIMKDPLGFLGKRPKQFDLYETNISPFLRFIHINNLLPAGWVKLPSGKYTVNDEKVTKCQIDLDIHWKDVKFYESEDMSPFITASYDIEADSSHGDFPLAKKNYKKLGGELLDAYTEFQKWISKKEVKLKQRRLFMEYLITLAFIKKEDFEKRKEIIDLIKSEFGYDFIHSDINYIFTKASIRPSENMIKSISKKIVKHFETSENYKILAYNILDNMKEDECDEMNIKNLLEDSFSNSEEHKTCLSIRKTWTKSNKYPTKYSIDKSVSKSTICYEKIFEVLDDLDEKEKQKFLDTYIVANDITKLDKKIDYIGEKCQIESNQLKNYIYMIEQNINKITTVYTEYLPEIDKSRDTYVKRVTSTLDEYFPAVEGDKVIQIGTVVQFTGSNKFLNHIVTLDTCSPIKDAEVVQCETEADVLIEWSKFINNLDPDIITGYNIFGFDFKYMFERAEELDIVEEFAYLGRIDGIISELECKTLASSALGDNNLSYITMFGRVQMDLLKIIQRDHNLVSYKLDYVAETFINDSITDITTSDGCSTLSIKGSHTLHQGNYITIQYGNDDKYMKGKKFKIKSIAKGKITLYEEIDESLKDKRSKWTLAKDDVSPQDIFRLQKGNADDRCIVATYCIMDCALCLHIINKLDIITNNIGMANVCFVPLSYLFMRGQGVKIFSFVAKQCRKEKFLIPVIKCKNEERKIDRSEINLKFDYDIGDTEVVDNDGGYEGAIVLKPTPGIYLDTPVSVMDYSSLYPSCMISENLSHDSIITDEKYMGDDGIKELEKLGYGYVDVTHDVYKWIDPKIKSKGKVKTGVKTCRFAQPKDGSKGVIPRILQALLSARKNTRKKIKYKTVTDNDGKEYIGLLEKTDTEHIIKNVEGKKWSVKNDDVQDVKDTFNEFEKAVKDGFQLAYKVTANSLYGQLGARTSPIYFKDIAASTTATGRQLLHLARDKVHEKFDGAEVVYGDTDSIFVNFNPKDKDGFPIKGKDGLKASIDLGVQAEEYIKGFLKPPHNLEYEKTFWPFILFSKKRYIGNKYEFDINKYKQTSMGIVLKRRDNADIVKHVYGGVMDIIMNQKDIKKSIKFLKESCLDLLNGKFPMDMLIITKSLRGFYKNPSMIAHKVLADRIGKRDPGNKPASNDRVPYVYIETNEKKGQKILQGDRIENPQYIKDNNLNPDYKFYITNQIMKPVGQIYALIVEQLEGYNKPDGYFERKYKSLKSERGEIKAKNKITDLRHEEASKLLFNEVIRIADNRKSCNREITDFFKVKKV